MSEYQFVATTVESETKASLLGAAALVVPAVLLLVIFKGLLPITNQGLLWLLVVAPALICFSMVMRFLQKHDVGVFTIRLDGRHITVVHPDRTVTDLGEVQRIALDYTADYKRADFSLWGSKDEEKLRLRSAATWNGRSSAKDFTELDKAAADINAVLVDQKAAQG